jgi:hypothetical protein
MPSVDTVESTAVPSRPTGFRSLDPFTHCYASVASNYATSAWGSPTPRAPTMQRRGALLLQICYGNASQSPQNTGERLMPIPCVSGFRPCLLACARDEGIALTERYFRRPTRLHGCTKRCSDRSLWCSLVWRADSIREDAYRSSRMQAPNESCGHISTRTDSADVI